jgi:ABC-type bacteriocin/lantibiotic exporter with double-glycine peptidase domain
MFRLAATTIVLFACTCSGLHAAEPAGIWLDVPFVKQEKDGCGAAVIAMVMQYWEKQQGIAPRASADAVHIQRALFSQEAHGIYASDLKRYFEQQGFRTFAFAGSWTELSKHLRKGRPLIVATKPGADAPLHYVVMTGLDEPRGAVMVNDPARRKLLKWDQPTFEKQWGAAGNWTLLAVPQQLER